MGENGGVHKAKSVANGRAKSIGMLSFDIASNEYQENML
jgi:hypothetical protein